MNQQAFVFIDDAARLAGVSRRTIYRDIESGKINQTQMRENGRRKEISIAELSSVYGNLVMPSTSTGTKGDAPNDTQSHTMSQENNEKIALVAPSDTKNDHDDLVSFLKEELKNERERSERWEARFLEAQEKLNGFLLPPPKPKPKKRGMFARMFGRSE